MYSLSHEVQAGFEQRLRSFGRRHHAHFRSGTESGVGSGESTAAAGADHSAAAAGVSADSAATQECF